ncbi:MAG: hypothetical protein QXE76_00505 [Candidatus Bathyarchaeia archaeon]
MVKTSTLLIISITALGFGTPVACVYFSVYHNFNWIGTTLLSLAAIIMAGTLGFFGIVTGPLGEQEIEGLSESEKKRLELMRTHQRATLEELDDIIEILKDIRELLKTAGE